MKVVLLLSITILYTLQIGASLRISVTNDQELSTAQRPTVIWHGMGDTCCYSFSMGRIQQIIENQINGIYVYSIEIGDSIEDDVRK